MAEKIKHYLLVAKPGIVLGNLISAAAGFVLASRGRVEPAVLLPAVAGIAMVVASGCVWNNCIDRKTDRRMRRTCNRALARGLMSPKVAAFYASLLGVAGTALLATTTNLLSVTIVLVGLTVYVALYSLYLKRTTAWAALIGSLAGAAPPLAGYCAACNRFDGGALILYLIFTLWQMPHCYAIAIFRFDDYDAAQIPVLPAEQGVAATKKHIIGYILAFMAVAPMLTSAGYAGDLYLAAAIAVSLCWLCMALSGDRGSDDRFWAKKLFVGSILIMIVLSVVMAFDATMPAESYF